MAFRKFCLRDTAGSPPFSSTVSYGQGQEKTFAINGDIRIFGAGLSLKSKLGRPQVCVHTARLLAS